ncbi:hypothetical protein EIK77_007261 [Talaromyces pinophilus]|nr:hypothetical protein EIK77_007261 [Talaromyces pinophilus]PCG95630.1 Hypothetical protein PENO1_072460 [Penicillium occitanis (nom. inval.)]PCG95797.1 hypothetical protein PENOC_075890 [Penicillium occitanis (nom. inval.)]
MDIMPTKDIPSNIPAIDHSHLQGLEERLLDLDRKILKYHDRLLENTDRLVTTTNHICNELRTLTRHINRQTSIINNTRHIVSAQARTISAQAQKIRAQQEIIDVMQRDIFRLGTWYSESLGRVNSHEEMLSERANEIRQLWQALERHTRFTEAVETETYWMHVYTKQVMLMRAADLASIGLRAAVDEYDDEEGDEGEDDGDGAASDTAASSVYTETPLVTPAQQHIMLDKIVLRMIEDAMPDALEDVRDGFEVVHGVSASIHGGDNAQASERGSDEDREILREDSDDGSMLV